MLSSLLLLFVPATAPPTEAPITTMLITAINVQNTHGFKPQSLRPDLLSSGTGVGVYGSLCAHAWFGCCASIGCKPWW